MNEKPAWVDSWRTLYPDATYIAQLGKVNGKANNKKDAESAKINAANSIAQYLQTNIRSDTKTSTASLTRIENGKVQTSTEKQNTNIITISVDVTLSNLEYTEPYFDRKEKNWYVLAYLSRQKAWEQYEPTVQNKRDIFFSFYNKAEEEPEPILALKFYKEALRYRDDFFNASNFGRIFSATLEESVFGADKEIASKVESKITETLQKCSFAVNVSNDTNSIVYNAIKSLLSEQGYIVKNAGENAGYYIQAEVSYDIQNGLGKLLLITPSIELSVNNKTKSRTFISYSKSCQRVQTYNEQPGKVKAAESIKLQLEESFMKEFNEHLKS